jgi:hypothetical protein
MAITKAPPVAPVLLIAVLASSVPFLDGTIVNVALPESSHRPAPRPRRSSPPRMSLRPARRH